MEYILITMVLALTLNMFPVKFIRCIFNLVFFSKMAFTYYYNQWETATIDVGLFICWYAIWVNIIWLMRVCCKNK